jgi:hypothetical protein
MPAKFTRRDPAHHLSRRRVRKPREVRLSSGRGVEFWNDLLPAATAKSRTCRDTFTGPPDYFGADRQAYCLCSLSTPCYRAACAQAGNTLSGLYAQAGNTLSSL